MISSISSASLYQYTSQTGSVSNVLTDDQKTKLQEIISQYDPNNMTADDMKSMMDEIKSAGITPSKGLKDTLDAAGFKPPEKPQGPPPNGQPPENFVQSGSSSNSSSTSSTSSSSDISQYLLDFLKKQNSGQVSQSDINSLIQKLTNYEASGSGSIIDQTA